jgi:hypothetical protein
VFTAVDIGIDIRRRLVLESKASLLQRLHYLLSMSCWYEDVICEICCDEEDGATF